ncbi:MAG: hypothetical protein ACOYKD_07620 [Anaerolineaceae bacterium]|jgi:hypothetical protein
MNKLKQLLSSRKFWAALLGLIVLVVKAYRPEFPLDAGELAGILAVLSTYILGTALEDGLSASFRN